MRLRPFSGGGTALSVWKFSSPHEAATPVSARHDCFHGTVRAKSTLNEKQVRGLGSECDIDHLRIQRP